MIFFTFHFEIDLKIYLRSNWKTHVETLLDGRGRERKEMKYSNKFLSISKNILYATEEAAPVILKYKK